GAARPKVCFLPTASGDADHYVVRFYRAFPASRCQASHISLFRRETGVADPRAHLLEQDVIYVGGGSLVSLLGTWRAHGLDGHLREAWEAGVILCGGSAGALCWFSQALSGFHEGPSRQIEGLGLLPYSIAVHYHEERGRRDGFIDAVSAGLCPGYGAGDSAALHFVDDRLSEVVSSRAEARAAYVAPGLGGRADEHELEVRYLGRPVLDGAVTMLEEALPASVAA
ncbi:MAG TPA: peptidase E, partial [Solirubrobacteraceae bacterium]|nr:peptidase E [Solirubrobacteraceae bacterium]